MEWQEINELSEKQGLTGISFHGRQRLYKEYSEQTVYLPIGLKMQWLGMEAYIQEENLLVDERCEETTRMLAEDSFRSCILKEQANACYYPQPKLRTSGNIDIWGSPIASKGLFEDRKLVTKYLINREDDYIRMQYHHIDYHIFPDVEVYFCPIVLFNYRKNERLQNKFGSGMDGNKNRNKFDQ